MIPFSRDVKRKCEREGVGTTPFCCVAEWRNVWRRVEVCRSWMNMEEFEEDEAVRTTSCGIASSASKFSTWDRHEFRKVFQNSAKDFHPSFVSRLNYPRTRIRMNICVIASFGETNCVPSPQRSDYHYQSNQTILREFPLI